MIKRSHKLARDSRGAAALEFALGAPVLITMVWGIFQVGLIFLANAGTQSALGEAARYATIYPTPSDSALQSAITAHKFGLKNGTWSTPTISTNTANGTKTISVVYSQPTNFLFFKGPTVSISKSKVVYLSS